MSQDPFAQPQYAYEPPKRRGCFFYGCITAIILFVLGAGGIAALLYFGLSQFANVLIENADDAPVVLPKVELPPEAQQSLEDRVKTFRENLEANKATPPLILTSDEVNALIAQHGENMADRIHVDLVGDKIEGQLSLPIEGLDPTGWFGLKGKYINAKGVFRASLENGVAIVVLDEAEVKGKPLPEQLMDTLRKDNLVKDITRDPKRAEMIRKFESIEVKDSTLIVKARDPAVEAAKEKAKKEKGEADAKAKETEKSESKDEPKAKDEPKPDAKPAPKDEPKPEVKEEAKPKG